MSTNIVNSDSGKSLTSGKQEAGSRKCRVHFVCPTTGVKGFTLVETLVAISIISVAMAGPFYAIQNALTYSYVARDQLIASSLAQEAVEYIRSRRDNAFLLTPSATWTNFLSGISACNAPGRCVIDATQNTISSTIAPLSISSANLYNQQGSGVASRFTRTVSITTISAQEIRVDVTVTWNTGKVSYTIRLSDYLQDWL